MTTVLVTGATGTIGSKVVRSLAGRGLDVRAAVRSPGKADIAGATQVRFDWSDAASVEAAFGGVDRVLLITPFVEEFATPSEAALAAAKAAGVKHVAKLSAAGAAKDGALSGLRQHAAVEEALAASGMGYTIVRPTFFMDNVLTYQAAVIKGTGAFYGASGGQKVSYISSADVGAVFAEVLAAPAVYAGQTLALTGGEAVSDVEIAGLIGKLTGKPVNFVDLELEQYAGALRQQGTPEWQVEALVGLEAFKRSGGAAGTTSTVRDILGRAPETAAQFFDRESARLRG